MEWSDRVIGEKYFFGNVSENDQKSNMSEYIIAASYFVLSRCLSVYSISISELLVDETDSLPLSSFSR